MTGIDPAETDGLPGERPSSLRPRPSRSALLGVAAVVLAAGGVGGGALAGGSAQAAEAAAPAHRGRQYSSASRAAKAVGRVSSPVFPHDPAAHLLRRATFGPRPADVALLRRLGIDQWLQRQLRPATIPDVRADRAARLYPLFGASPRTVVAKTKPFSADAMMDATQGSLVRQIFSDRQLFEIVVDVMANHLHVPIPGEQWHTAPSYLSDVIRKHAFGRFEDMLQAAMKHPAMLNFLSNDQSQRADVNENLGRELLELHTVGRASGYTEREVRASAQIMSGRTWDYDSGEYRFDGSWHWTGRVAVLGFSHANASGSGGEAVGDAYLRYLARHPATARTIATKLAVRFVSDQPSASLIDRLAQVYLASGTDIRAVVAAVFRSSDFWAAVGTRMRRPLEDAVGALRVLDIGIAPGMEEPLGWLHWGLSDAGHTPHGWVPPNGTPDVAAAWLGAGAMLLRWNLHRDFVFGWGWWQHLGRTPPSRLVPRTRAMTTAEWTRSLSRRLLGTVPTQRHLAAVIRGAGLRAADPAPAEDAVCGKVAALLLDSPYFQLR